MLASFACTHSTYCVVITLVITAVTQWSTHVELEQLVLMFMQECCIKRVPQVVLQIVNSAFVVTKQEPSVQRGLDW